MFTSGSGTTETFTKDWSYSEHRHSHSEPRLLPPPPSSCFLHPTSCTLLPDVSLPGRLLRDPQGISPPIHAPHPTPPPSLCPRPRRPPQPWPGHCPVQGVESVRRKVTLRATRGQRQRPQRETGHRAPASRAGNRTAVVQTGRAGAAHLSCTRSCASLDGSLGTKRKRKVVCPSGRNWSCMPTTQRRVKTVISRSPY